MPWYADLDADGVVRRLNENDAYRIDLDATRDKRGNPDHRCHWPRPVSISVRVAIGGAESLALVVLNCCCDEN